MINNTTRISTVKKYIARVLDESQLYCGVYGIRVQTVQDNLVDRFVSNADEIHYFNSFDEFENYEQSLIYNLQPEKLIKIHTVVNSNIRVKELYKIWYPAAA